MKDVGSIAIAVVLHQKFNLVLCVPFKAKEVNLMSSFPCLTLTGFYCLLCRSF